MKNKTCFILGIALAGIFLVSCSKENIKNDESIEQEAQTAVDEIEMEDLLMDLSFELDDLDFWLYGFKDGRDRLDCKKVTVEPEERGVFPKTITVDFGDGCNIKDGVVKKGKIIIEMSAPMNSEEWTKKVSFDGYSVNDKLFEGGKRISYVREGRRGLPTWQINSRMRVKWDTDSFVQHTSERTRYQTKGFDTPRRPMDDAFILTGSGTGINRKGLAFKRTIEEPLHFSRDCFWIKKGIIKLQTRGESEVILDYGDGNCDNLATITKDGESKEIKLKKK